MPQQNDKASISSVTRIKSKVKVVFLGEQSTGKTSILMRFLNGKFEESQGVFIWLYKKATVGIDFMGKNFTINNHHLRLQLWDTAGQEQFRSLIPSYLKDAMITIIVFDLTSMFFQIKKDDKTLENIGEWVDLCSHNRNEKNVIVFLGNKQDLNQTREISEEMISEKLDKYGRKYFEVSAKTGYNIQEVFNYACEEFIKVNMIESEITFTAINEEMQKRFASMSQSNISENNKSKSKEKDKDKSEKKSIDEKKGQENIMIKNNVGKENEKKKKKGCC